MSLNGAATRKARARQGLVDKAARKAVQVGFLLLFAYPIVPVLYNRVTQKPGPVFTSWLLPWDPLLLLGHIVHRNWSALVIGAPLLLLALTLFAGRFFCGWVCPVGTILDLVRPLAWWQRRRRPARRERAASRTPLARVFPPARNSPARYLVLAGVVIGGALSIQALGALDPLVIFHRTLTGIASDLLALQKPALRIYLTASAIFLAIVVLELWQPRFWCRHLCPLGALLSLPARWTLLNRRVSAACNSCGQCRRVCAMRAIPEEGHDTSYADCHLCLACESVCPQGAITFGLGTLSGRRWQTVEEPGGGARRPARRSPGQYVRREGPRIALSRRGFVAGLAAGATGLALPPALAAASQTPVVRPPGALPEPDFLRTCILCQECVRVCPSNGLRPATWQAGAAGVGTPQLVARQGGCLRWTSCEQLCAQVCPAGAIERTPREKMKIGRAVVERTACLAWDQGVKCLVCVEACPTGAAQPFNGRVTVDPQKCIGCGLCEHACPVANGAIHVSPSV